MGPVDILIWEGIMEVIRIGIRLGLLFGRLNILSLVVKMSHGGGFQIWFILVEKGFGEAW